MAAQEIIRCVTNSGIHAPDNVHSVFGWVASVTSAKTIAGELLITTSASWAAGWPLHVAVICAQGGMSWVGVAWTLDEGAGEGDGEGVACGETDGDGCGLVCVAAVELDPQAASTTAATATRPSLRLTGHENDNA